MAADIFAKIGDIKGESLDKAHKSEVEVLSWSWGVAQTSSLAYGGGGGGAGTGKATFQDLHFTHVVDAASPNFLMACASGQHIKDAKLTARKAGGTQQEYLVIKMSDVMITSVSDSGHEGSAPPSESVSLHFGKVELEYKPQKPDGSLDAGIHFKWNITQNVKA